MSNALEEGGKPKSELRLRVISAVLLAIAVLAITWVGGYTFQLLCALASLIIYFEYSRIVGSAGPVRVLFGGGLFLLLLIAGYLSGATHTVVWVLVTSLVVLTLWELVVSRSIWTPVGLLYAYLPFLSLSEIRSDTMAGLVIVLVVFGCVWGSDIAAYFAGRAIGGPKLAPSVSPKKTWSGFVGGLFGAVFLAGAVALVAGFMPSAAFVGLIVIMSIASQMGDLFESWIKRRFDVKDSGNIIPGHGGVMDRIDGLIFASVLAALFGYFLMQNAAGLSVGEGLAETLVNAMLMPR